MSSTAANVVNDPGSIQDYIDAFWSPIGDDLRPILPALVDDKIGAELYLAQLNRVDLSGAYLYNADFRQADLNGACFKGTKSNDAYFGEARLHGAEPVKAWE